MPSISLWRLGTRAVLVVDQFEEKQVEHCYQQADCAPEQHWQTAEVMSVFVQNHDVMLVRWRCNKPRKTLNIYDCVSTNHF